MTAVPLGVLAGWLAPLKPYTGRHRDTQTPPAVPHETAKPREEAR